MKKLLHLEIDKCADCPWCKDGGCTEYREVYRAAVPPAGVPAWCPLPNTEEDPQVKEWSLAENDYFGLFVRLECEATKTNQLLVDIFECLHSIHQILLNQNRSIIEETEGKPKAEGYTVTGNDGTRVHYGKYGKESLNPVCCNCGAPSPSKFGDLWYCLHCAHEYKP